MKYLKLFTSNVILNKDETRPILATWLFVGTDGLFREGWIKADGQELPETRAEHPIPAVGRHCKAPSTQTDQRLGLRASPAPPVLRPAFPALLHPTRQEEDSTEAPASTSWSSHAPELQAKPASAGSLAGCRDRNKNQINPYCLKWENPEDIFVEEECFRHKAELASCSPLCINAICTKPTEPSISGVNCRKTAPVVRLRRMA